MESTARATAEPARTISVRARDLAELAIGYVLILIVIWTPRPWQKIIYFIAAAFIIAATSISPPGWKEVGLRPKKFARSIWVMAAALLFAASSVAIAWRIGTLHAPTSPSMFVKRYAGYVIFACLQQALLQDFFLVRFLRLGRPPQAAAIAAAALFSLAHLPNPILTVLTFVWGLTACLLFLRYRNLYVLAVAHAILGVTLAMSVPGPMIHNMRVGLGYITYHPHALQQRNH